MPVACRIERQRRRPPGRLRSSAAATYAKNNALESKLPVQLSAPPRCLRARPGVGCKERRTQEQHTPPTVQCHLWARPEVGGKPERSREQTPRPAERPQAASAASWPGPKLAARGVESKFPVQLSTPSLPPPDQARRQACQKSGLAQSGYEFICKSFAVLVPPNSWFFMNSCQKLWIWPFYSWERSYSNSCLKNIVNIVKKSNFIEVLK